MRGETESSRAAANDRERGQHSGRSANVSILSPLSGMGVYAITHTASGRRYVGSTTNLHLRRRTHLWNLNRGAHCNKWLQHAWVKYGADAFTFGVLERVGDATTLGACEQRWMDSSPLLYNHLKTAHVAHGYKHTRQTKEAWREAHRRAWRSPECRQRMIDGLREAYKSPALRRKISLAVKASMTPERIRQIRDQSRGRVVPECQRTDMRDRRYKELTIAKQQAADRSLSVAEARALLGCSKRTLLRMIHQGDIQAIRQGRFWLIAENVFRQTAPALRERLANANKTRMATARAGWTPEHAYKRWA